MIATAQVGPRGRVRGELVSATVLEEFIEEPSNRLEPSADATFDTDYRHGAILEVPNGGLKPDTVDPLIIVAIKAHADELGQLVLVLHRDFDGKFLTDYGDFSVG